VPHHATLTFTEPLVRAAVLAFWQRTVGAGYVVALVVLAASLGVTVWFGDRSWVAGALGTSLVLGVVFVVLIYVVHLRRGLAVLRAMQDPVATLQLDDDALTVTSELGSTSLRWSAVSEVWRFPAFWLVLVSKAQFMTLPIESVSPEARTFLVARVEAAGGRVLG
jgi:hypothetical protein